MICLKSVVKGVYLRLAAKLPKTEKEHRLSKNFSNFHFVLKDACVKMACLRKKNTKGLKKR